MLATRGDFAEPDEWQRFSKRQVKIINLGSGPIRRVEVDAGWRWSEHERAEAGIPSCDLHHLGYMAAGRLHVVMDDGQELEIAAGEVFEIPPGHDAWTVGPQSCVFIDLAHRQDS